MLSARAWSIIAVCALLLAGGLWYVLVRSVSARAGPGVITAKTFEPARTTTRTEPSPRGGTGAERRYVFPDRWQFTIQLDGEPTPVRYGLEATAGNQYDVGQRVRVSYDRRGLPPLWERIYVREMSPAATP